MLRRVATPPAGPPVVTSPAVTLNTVFRRDEEADDSGLGFVGGGGGGGTEKRARSCASVSRIREVMSGFERSALVKIFGGGKLGKRG